MYSVLCVYFQTQIAWIRKKKTCKLMPCGYVLQLPKQIVCTSNGLMIKK